MAPQGAQKEDLLEAGALPLMVKVEASHFEHPVRLGYLEAENVEWEKQV